LNIATQEYEFENTSLLHEVDAEQNPKFGKRTSNYFEQTIENLKKIVEQKHPIDNNIKHGNK